ncbi:MAG: agmatine deiminase family protein [Minwuia sp.]|uniref:agmatine deiminase family protein n=1 Tax=Minwuia sp. TaxID=2493630 RepID=UPI003A83B83C
MTEDNPSFDGFFPVPDWAPHTRTWMSWPTDPEEMPGGLLESRVAFAHIARAIARHEPVRMIVPADVAKEAALTLGPRVEIIERPSAHGWIRDLAPTFITTEDGRIKTVAWKFNGWGGRHIVHEEDHGFAEELVRLMDFANYRGPIVLEGGAVQTDGLGTAIVTEQTLLSPNRNPLIGRSEAEEILMRFFGIVRVIWLGEGISGLKGGGGHVGRFCRFIRPGVVAIHSPDDPEHPDFRAMQDNLNRLKLARSPFGGEVEVIEFPVPEKIQPASSSYMGFYLARGVVLTPRLNDPVDDEALRRIAELFPDREAVQVEAEAVGGSLHHMALGEPEPTAL